MTWALVKITKSYRKTVDCNLDFSRWGLSPRESLLPVRVQLVDFLIGRLDEAFQMGDVLLGTGLGQMEAGTLDQSLAIGNLLTDGQLGYRLLVQLIQLRQ